MNAYAVQGNAPLVIGQIYEVRNSRKGTFQMRITKVDGEWITGVITDGVASAMMRYNVREEGEEVTVRDVHSYFIPA